MCRRYLNCVEHALGLEDWAKYHNATVVATNDKEGDDSGRDSSLFLPYGILYRRRWRTMDGAVQATGPGETTLNSSAELDKLLPKADVLVTTVSAAHVECI